ncbi:hypothetical protein [Sphingobacterium sp. 2149]|uniref:hypothetical protein n=1 Tax=Sphingobacterium sp. 2149 TaxID=2817763 RepID=UPI0028643B27|nr:hypothetical protein [Sphingobacterium sp. 2149]MDR6734162.1 hypothetical protein [Sphingobacterium sp. 2149]
MRDYVKYDGETPPILDAAKVSSIMGVDSETGEVGNVDFALIVNEAGKKIGDAVKITGNTLPTLGTANKYVEVYGGANGRTLVYGDNDFILQKDSVVKLFWDGILKTWEIADSATLSFRSILKIEMTSSTGLKDNYTITFSDGTTQLFSVTNGKNSDVLNITVNGEVVVPNDAGQIAIIVPDENLVNIAESERTIGTYSLGGEYMPVYSTTFKLNALPVQQGEIKEYILSDEPLGYGLFLNIAKTSVSAGKTLFGSYYNTKYSIENIHVNNEFQTIIEIKCLENIISVDPVYMLLNLEYLKYDGNIVEFTVDLPAGTDPSAITLSFPKLKFNKKFAFSYITDDSYSIYQFIFSGINKRWVATGNTSRYLHLNFPISPNFTEGFTPNYPLSFTDGAGNNRRFATSVAVWPDKLVDESRGIGGDVGMFWPWMSEKEFKLYRDFGFTVLYHDFNGYDGSSVTQENFNHWFADTKAKFIEYINDSPKIIAEPNGDHRYLTLSQSVSDIMMNTAQSGHTLIKKAYPYRSGFNLDKSIIAVERWFAGEDNYDNNVFSKLQQFNDTADLENVYWLIGAAHKSSEWEYNLFKRINDAFGSMGSDKIWFASVDEIYEYWYLTTNATVIRSLGTNQVTFKLYFPRMPRFWFNEVSCLLSGVSALEGLSISSNTDGLSYAINGGKLLVNLNFNKDLLTRAEKYTAAFEATPNASYVYDDAMYMVSQLKPSLRQPFIDRLNVYSSAPTFADFKIENGATTTQKSIVALTMLFTGTSPTHYMVSESSNFLGAEWINFVSPASYELSAGFDTKTVYVKLKNTYGESLVLSAQIYKAKPDLALTSITVAGQVSSSPVPVTLNYTGIPTHYRLAAANDFTGVQWIAFGSNPVNFTIAAPYGQKTVFAQIRDEVEDKTSTIVSATFQYVDPVSAILTAIAINNGDQATGSGIVTVKFTTVNTITHYRIGQQTDLSAVAWVAYAGDTVSYNSGVNSGTLTLYAQVKNSTSESDVKTSSINVVIPVTATAMALADGQASFAGFNPKVSFTIGAGTPTHYRLAETSAGVSTAAWLPWSDSITFTFASIGAKTLYGQVKNAVSESSVVNDTITLIEPPVAVLIGFNGSANNSNLKVVTAGLTTNQINLATFSGYNAQQLVNTQGTNVNGWFMNLQSDFYANNSVFNGSFTGNPPNVNAVEASGNYSLATMAKCYTASSAGAENTGKKARISFSLPAGQYKIRILWNTGSTNYTLTTDTTRSQCFYGMFQGTTELARTICSQTAGFNGLGNQDFNAEMTFTVIDGAIPVDFGAWSTSLNNRPGFNLIEITKIS